MRDGCDYGKSDYKKSAAFVLIPACDLPAVILNDSIRCAQTQPGALSDRFGCVKGIEDALRISQPWTVVGKLENHIRLLA